MRFLIPIICCLLPLVPVLHAEQEHHQYYSLDQLIELMKTNNLLLKISGIDKKIAREEYRIGRALPNPEFEYSTGEGELPGEAHHPSLHSLGLKWSFPNPIHRYFALKSMRKSITAAEIEMEMKKRELVKNLKIHFFRHQFYRKITTFMEEKLRILDEVGTITKAKVSLGEVKEIDSLRASVEVQKIKTDLFRAGKTAAYEKTKVNEFLNYSLPEDFMAGEDFTFAPLPNIEENVQSLIDRSPHILLHSNRVEQERDNHKAESVSIIESVELFGEKEKEIEGDVWRIGIGVSVPLFNWKTAQTRKAKLQEEKARTEFEHAKKHFYADVNRMISEIRILEKEIETFKGAILEEGRENLELSERLYKEGEIPLVVFLDAQSSFFEVQERYFEAITEWNLLKADLEELIGEQL
jgi:cobalt-zinc-cadmium efflux system outer membrane protein